MFPRTTEDTANAIQLFKIISNSPIPQVIGAIDGTHIEILRPRMKLHIKYTNYKLHNEYTSGCRRRYDVLRCCYMLHLKHA